MARAKKNRKHKRRNKKEEAEPATDPRSMLLAYRAASMHGYKYLRLINPGLSQGGIGWIKRRLSSALIDNPFMDYDDLEGLVDSLNAIAPTE